MKKKFTHLLLMVLIAFLPIAALAQLKEPATSDAYNETVIIEVQTVENIESPGVLPVVEEVTSPQEATTTQESIDTGILEEVTSPQEATTTQESIDTGILEETTNPQQSEVPAPALDSINTATTTLEAAANNGTSTDAVIEIIPEAEEEIIGVIEPEIEVVTGLVREILKPQKEYTFDINGASIATKENPEWTILLDEKQSEKDNLETAIVREEPELNLHAGPNTLNVAGNCSDSYFVVLIYKNDQDYDTSPSSYIYNRAFPCENGHYDYALSELPFSLETDTYYLLVAGQGERGPWHPISAMIPIGITVKTIISEATTTDESNP